MHHKIQSIFKNPIIAQSGQEESNKLATIFFNLTSTPILFLDQEHKILEVNPSCTRLLGFDQSELAGKPISMLFNENQLLDFVDLQDALQHDEQYWRSEFTIKKAHGSPVELEITVHRTQLKDHIIFALYLDHSQLNWNRADKPRKTIRSSGPLSSAVHNLQRKYDRYQSNQAHHIQVNILPILEKISQEQDHRIRNNFKNMLIRELALLFSDSALEVDPELLKLTPTEMDVCRYIQSGLSSKQIAAMMYSSFDTIQTHRKNIRKKMGLNSRKISLCTYLRVKKGVRQSGPGKNDYGKKYTE